MAEYLHGAFGLQEASGISVPAKAGTLPVYFGVAPVHQLADYARDGKNAGCAAQRIAGEGGGGLCCRLGAVFFERGGVSPFYERRARWGRLWW